MLDQLFNIVKQFGQQSVVDNPNVPNQYNQDILQDATHTIAGGFQNILAGGGFQNILNLFRGGGSGAATGGGLSGLLQNPIVNMMVGHFVSKLVGKYNMSASAASQVANHLIPNSVDDLIRQTNDPSNDKATLDNLVAALTGKAGNAAGAAAAAALAANGGNTVANTGNPSSSLQDLLNQFTGSSGSQGAGGFDLQNIISNITSQAQNQMQQQSGGGGGLMDMIKGLLG